MTPPKSIAIALEAIEQGLLHLGLSQTVGSLLPGVSADVVRDELAEVGLRSSTELEQWFAWHNGISTPTIGSMWICPGYFPSSLERIVANQRALVTDGRWSPQWLPLMEDGGGYFYVIDQSVGTWPIRLFRNDWVEHVVEYVSLGALAATLADAYREQVFNVDAEGFLSKDAERYAAVARRHNPGVAWWD
jgi:hypothetical protein